MTFWKVYPEAESELFNIHGLNHKIDLVADFALPIPSLTIWPDIVQMIPAEVPDSSKAKVKSRPVAGAINWLRR